MDFLIIKAFTGYFSGELTFRGVLVRIMQRFWISFVEFFFVERYFLFLLLVVSASDLMKINH